MNLNIDNLVIEATRKCNMNCSHCLRGADQRKCADNQHIHRLMQVIDYAGTLTITGGEPTLNMDALEYIRTEILYGNAHVGNFFMVTNGKSINVDKLAQWAFNMHNCCDDNEMSSIGFSFDNFHTETFNWEQREKQQRNYQRLKDKMYDEYGIDTGLGGGDFIHKHSDGSWGYQNLLQEGRAEESGCRDTRIDMFGVNSYDDGGDDFYISENELTLTCSGWLIAGCNWSYKSMDNNKNIQVAHINDIYCADDLLKAIENFNEKRENILQVA